MWMWMCVWCVWCKVCVVQILISRLNPFIKTFFFSSFFFFFSSDFLIRPLLDKALKGRVGRAGKGRQDKSIVSGWFPL